MQRIATRESFLVFLSVLSFFGIVFSSFQAYGSSYKSLNFKEVVNKSGLVFEGRVVEKEFKIPEDRNRIYTYVTFEILDIIKGDYNQPTMILRYPGGVMGEMVYAISDMKIPEESEHGIYFVRNLKKRFVHPLTGWSQGHMLIVKDPGGAERITSVEHKPITSIRLETPAARPPQITETDKLAPMVPRGVVTTNRLNIDQALSVTEAKEIIKNLIQGE